ncbi:MAG: hypothetical protein BECKG1743D_GA0114223_108633 [Candidatus Kentron sp. G]|nr:MAG: hypothetical protein BECKG1743F_GA0114225_108773 [Candidatus Kentron sp. G]VFN06431.1 MAG: hypothetical protein BECKG1743D_GA0114223_108633 [Candidatus Kentron sp. G]
MVFYSLDNLESLEYVILFISRSALQMGQFQERFTNAESCIKDLMRRSFASVYAKELLLQPSNFYFVVVMFDGENGSFITAIMFLFVFHEPINQPFYAIHNKFILYGWYHFVYFLYPMNVPRLFFVIHICIIPCNMGHFQRD